MIQLIEEMALNSWPAINTYYYDGWLLRDTNGYSKRTNSVWPMSESTLSLQEKLIFCKDYYQRLDLPVVFKLTSRIEHKLIDQFLCEKQFLKQDETSVMTINIPKLKLKQKDEVEVITQISMNWVNSYISCADLEIFNIDQTLYEMLSRIKGTTVFLSYYKDNQVVACGYGVIDREYLGVFGIYVKKEFRGRGFSKVIMNRLFNEATDRGISKSYLQVECKNTVAQQLYKKLGYQEQYKYWYRRPLYDF